MRGRKTRTKTKAKMATLFKGLVGTIVPFWFMLFVLFDLAVN